MAKNKANEHAYGDLTNGIWVAQKGTTAPTAPLPVAWGAGWKELGWLSDAGITEAKTMQETKKYAMQGATLQRVLRAQNEYAFTFDCWEETATVLGLRRPGSTTTTTSGANEVDTITVSGTAGTFTVTVNGATTPAQAYNVPLATLQTALQALPTVGSGNVTVTGTAGASYVLTFSGGLANTAMTVSAVGTGGATASSVQTTAGAPAINTTSVVSFTGQDIRAFGIDLVDSSSAASGTVHKRLIIPTGEAMPTGNVVYHANDLTTYQFQLQAYPDANGVFFYDVNDNPALAAGA